jgi:4a-hydroxytetrahydrobiopterin dehydratase
METIKPYSEEEIQNELGKMPGWQYINDKISKTLSFKDFLDALRFVNEAAKVFEAEKHHADIQIAYNNVTFELQRFDVGGKVTNLDFKVARKIDELYESWPKE